MVRGELTRVLGRKPGRNGLGLGTKRHVTLLFVNIAARASGFVVLKIEGVDQIL